MSKNAELTRKDMKAPDQFQVVAGQAVSWVKGHRRKATALVGALAVVLLSALVVAALGERSARQAGGALSEVYKVAAGEISSVPLPGVAGPFFADEAARQRAVVEAADRALAAHGSSRGGALSALAKGDAHYRLGEWDAAASAYQTYLASAPKEDAFRFGALEGLALVEEAKGNTEGAVAAYARLGAEVPTQADRADLEKARLLASSGKAAEARKLLAGFDEAHKASPLAGQASERLAKLGGQ